MKKVKKEVQELHSIKKKQKPDGLKISATPSQKVITKG